MKSDESQKDIQRFLTAFGKFFVTVLLRFRYGFRYVFLTFSGI